MESPFFSIIVPVFNVENFVQRCIDSVKIQSYEGYELILVDDGSTDKSGYICDKNADNKHIKVIHQSNSGASTARNTGIKYASGEYLMFIDSDDCWVDSDALLKIKKQIDQYQNDVILFGCNDVYTSTGKIVKARGNYELEIINEKDKAKTLDSLFYSGQFPGSAWIMSVSRNLILQNVIKFPEGVTGEDIIWVNYILENCKSIGAINDVIYHYHKDRPGQVTSKSSVKGCEGMLFAISSWLQSPHRNMYKGISNQMAHIYLVLLMHYSTLSRKERTAVSQRIENASDILSGTSPSCNRIIKKLINVFGPYLPGIIIKFAHKLKSSK